MLLSIPQYTIKNNYISGNNIYQLGFLEYKGEVQLRETENGYIYFDSTLDKEVLITNKRKLFKEFDYVLKYNDDILNERTELRWFRFNQNVTLEKLKEEYDQNYRIKKEIVSYDSIISKGLRVPQVGAIHAIMSNISNPDFKEGIVVMPTGTGKTEVMLTTFLSGEIKRLIVVVPNDALRKQIGNKFKQLGILKDIGVISKQSKYPSVGIIKNSFKDSKEENNFFKKCNVIVTTIQLAIKFDSKVLNDNFSHLFIDEAHHITINNWGEISNIFKGQIVQFTATPYRNDGKMLKGNIIYKYSLLQAQKEKYFKKINYEPIIQFDEKKSDEFIAMKAIEVLKKDIESGYEHVIMARVESVRRANEVFKIYSNIAGEYNPILIHNQLLKKEKDKRLEQLVSGKTRIVVCVNMLGEGFDFPRLKIAAIHDSHKTIAPTIQFIGRFTRTSIDKIGDATVIANVSTDSTNKTIEELYSQDSDWNLIIRQAADGLVEKEDKKIKFLQKFKGEIPKIIPLQNIYPALSMYIFKTNYNHFYIDAAIKKIKKDNIIISQNYDDNILACVERVEEKTDWCKNEDVKQITYNLYVIYYDSNKKIFYVGTTTKNPPLDIVSCCFNDDYELINGETTFKCLFNINRLKLSTLGLNANSSGYVSYRMYAGRDVIEGISDTNKLNSYKNNLFGKGYENQNETSIGCSKKGKIWCKKIGNLLEWKEWCDLIGGKVSNPNIKVEELIKGIPIPKDIEAMPEKVPISIEFQPDILIENESRIFVKLGDKKAELTEVDIKLLNNTSNNNIKFIIESEDKNISQNFEMTIVDKKAIYTESKGNIEIKSGNKYIKILEWFKQYPPKITYADGSTLENTYYLEFSNDNIPNFNKEDLIVYDWSNIDIRKESQGINKERDTIQYKTIESIKDNGYNLIFDDDGSGEAADVIAIKVENEIINIDFFHCKFSTENIPGSRIGDLYVVCGQAQKSIVWKCHPDKLLRHMLKREHLRIERYPEKSRFEVGNEDIINSIINMTKVYSINMNVYIVQPGVSKEKISDQQLRLLGVTKNWLFDTLGVKLKVIVSK